MSNVTPAIESNPAPDVMPGHALDFPVDPLDAYTFFKVLLPRLGLKLITEADPDDTYARGVVTLEGEGGRHRITYEIVSDEHYGVPPLDVQPPLFK